MCMGQGCVGGMVALVLMVQLCRTGNPLRLGSWAAGPACPLPASRVAHGDAGCRVCCVTSFETRQAAASDVLLLVAGEVLAAAEVQTRDGQAGSGEDRGADVGRAGSGEDSMQRLGSTTAATPGEQEMQAAMRLRADSLEHMPK